MSRGNNMTHLRESAACACEANGVSALGGASGRKALGVDPEIAWAREIERRLTRLRNGESRTVPWSKVRADVLRRLRNRR